ncbi:MAG: tyrosine--tRNA ligase [Alphaproteobacteria bacterium]|nr:tyrosine--tRNA ligase [Alphaproteobacteria bacterium]OJV16289.1 MAG: tyrosine--tRNA ligase [Alphaproteobacteria bacterium 33-17]
MSQADIDTNNLKSAFLKEFVARGFYYQSTDLASLDKLFAEESVTVYIGFDCTAKTLHVGSLMQIMLFKLLQKHGHKPLVLIGGGTTKIGDPSGRDEARKLLTDELIQENFDGIKNTIAQFISFGNTANSAKVVNNNDWLKDLKYIEFLRDYGSLFSVNRMLAMDSVKIRLEREQNLSFLEFNYMLLQAYDFMHLNKAENCRVQIGGSDQWSNIINGVDLVRKMGGKESYGLTTPLITTANGSKMGKTANGAVWLSSEFLPAYDYWQFWRNTDDRDVFRFMRYFTDIPVQEIAEFEKSDKNINDFKVLLANEATSLCHGREAAEQAHQTALNTFYAAKSGEGLPEFKIDGEPMLYDAIKQSGLADSNGEAKRHIKAGAVRLDDEPVTDEFYKITDSIFSAKSRIKLSVGKKKHIILTK